MASDVDWELYARLNLYEFLFEVMLARQAASIPNGQAELAEFRAAIVDRMVNRARMSMRLSDEDHVEWKLNAKAVTERLFDKAEDRRAEIAATLGNKPGNNR
jgi:hypothetical protein